MKRTAGFTLWGIILTLVLGTARAYAEKPHQTPVVKVVRDWAPSVGNPYRLENSALWMDSRFTTRRSKEEIKHVAGQHNRKRRNAEENTDERQADDAP